MYAEQERTSTQSTGVYAEYKGVRRVQGCAQSTGNVRGVRDCISIYAEYKLFMSYDTSRLNQRMICIMLLTHYNKGVGSKLKLGARYYE